MVGGQKEHKMLEIKFSTPGKALKFPKCVTDTGDLINVSLGTLSRNLYVQERLSQTILKLLTKVRKKITFKDSRYSLRRIMDELAVR
jgi:hypothetical protein